MSLSLFAAFALATVILVLIPGPNVALLVANSVAHGARFGFVTLAGTISAMVVQLTLTGLGLSAALHSLASLFGVLRWIGVAYLVWLGVAAWRAPGGDLSRVAAEPRSARAIFLRAFLVSLTNPKTLLFYTAFFPQFIDSAKPLGPQFFLLSVAFLSIALVLDSGWVTLAARFREVLRGSGRWRQRVTGGALIGAGIGLAAARLP